MTACTSGGVPLINEAVSKMHVSFSGLSSSSWRTQDLEKRYVFADLESLTGPEMLVNS
jgi:hypothetical protein